MSEKVEVKYDIPPFTIVPHWVAERLKPTELATYVVLGKYADNVTKECWPSLNTIAKDLGRSKTATITAIKGLAAKGVLKVDKRKNDKGDWSRNHYTLMVYGGSQENLTTPSKENLTTGSKENLTVTIPNITIPNELYFDTYDKTKQDTYIETLKACFHKDRPTKTEYGQMTRTAKELFTAGISPNEIPTLVKNMVITYGEQYTTVNSIKSHTELVNGAKTKSGKEVKKAVDQNQLERWANEQ